MATDVYGTSLRLFTSHCIEHSCACESKETCQQGLEKTLETSMNAGYLGIRLFPIEGLIETLSDRATGDVEETLGDVINSMRLLMIYGVNICRNPRRTEYKVIKTYTGFFQAKIADCFPEYSLVLTGFGYSEGEYSDELHLQSIPRNINEFVFGVLLAVIELRRIRNLVRIAVELKGTIADALAARRYVQNGRQWKYQEAVVYLINNKRVEHSAYTTPHPIATNKRVEHPAYTTPHPIATTQQQQQHMARMADVNDNRYSSYEDLGSSGAASRGRRRASASLAPPDYDDIAYTTNQQATAVQHLQQLSLRRYSDAGQISPRSGQRSPQQRQVKDELSFMYENYDKIPDIYEQ